MLAFFLLIRRLWFLICIFGVGVVLVQMGARKRHASEIHAALKAPTLMTCADFVRKSPSDGWYRISDCTTNAIEGIFLAPKESDSSSSGTPRGIDELAIPVHTDPDDTRPAKLVVLTKDSTLRGIVSDLDGLGAFGDLKKQDEAEAKDDDSSKDADKPLDASTKSKLRDYAKKNATRIFVTRTIEGMVRTPDDFDSEEKKIVSGTSEFVLPAHVILVEGETPSTEGSGNGEIVGGILALTLGVFITLMTIVGFIKKAR